MSEGADHGTRPHLRSSSYCTPFRAQCATVRGEARDDPPIINVNGVDDEHFVVIDEDDAFPNDYVDEEDIPTDASEGQEGPDAGVLDLYLKLFQLRDLVFLPPHLCPGNNEPVKSTTAAAPCTLPARFFLGTVYAPPISRSAAAGCLGTAFRLPSTPRPFAEVPISGSTRGFPFLPKGKAVETSRQRSLASAH